MRRPTPRQALAALVVAALWAGVAGGTTGPPPAADPAPRSVAAERWNLYTPTPTPSATPTPTRTDTPTPYCTGPGCGDTPGETVVEETPGCTGCGLTPPTETPTPEVALPTTTAPPSPGSDGWTALLRPLLAFLAVGTVGLLAVGTVLVRWRLLG